MSPPVLYRSDEHKFSVYRLRDIPDGVRCSGAADAGWWRHQPNIEWALRSLGGRAWLSKFSRADYSPHHLASEYYCVAVADEHAGPLRERFRVGMRVRPSADGRSVYCDTLRPGSVVAMGVSSTGTRTLEVMLDGAVRSYLYSEAMWEPDRAPRFTVGMRVRPSEWGLELMTWLKSGSVTAVSWNGRIEVQRDGFSAAQWFDARAWEPDDQPAPPLIIGPMLIGHDPGAGDDRGVAISIPADEFHREATKHLGAQHGEATRDRPQRWSPVDSNAWTVAVRHKAETSAQARKRADDALVGWDPYGDDA